jgi:hypothetical protein
MLQAHSLLWHYLWVAPNLFLLTLAFFLWKRGVRRQFPSFFVFAILSAVGELAVYAADISPFILPENFWRIYWANSILEGVLKFVVIGEIFALVFGAYSYLANLGKILIRSLGVVLVMVAATIAAYAPKNEVGIISGAQLLEQSTYLVESGVLLFIFLFAAYFHLRWSRPPFGIALGLSISACVHLATWAVFANSGMPHSTKVSLTFLNMATYHLCVLIWCYYLLVPSKVVTKSAVAMPEHNLEVWNRELERLLQQ